jgi:hypothetical protein
LGLATFCISTKKKKGREREKVIMDFSLVECRWKGRYGHFFDCDLYAVQDAPIDRSQVALRDLLYNLLS